MHKIRTVAVLPTMFTLGNLVCGFFAIVVAARVERPEKPDIPHAEKLNTLNPVQAVGRLDRDNDVHNCMLSGWLIFLAMIFDALDGHVARLSKATSDFGAQLDSLCDLVTFGVAPAFLMVKMCPSFAFAHNDTVWVIAAAFAACAAMRLARFNVETDDNDDHLNFTGLPSPAAAAAMASFAILFYTLRQDGSSLRYFDIETVDHWVQNILPFFAVLTALLMVSRIPYPHVVNQLFSGQRSFAHLVTLVIGLTLVMMFRGYSVPLISGFFVFQGPVRYVWQEYVQRKPHEDPLF
ncbi:MAG TPA: CDP-diacylglycerol--serine O-phosphatidyltransferase [Pirellulales bacterium]|jgi:CDP-diacylglycerol--serine O-phosphatidyltransferase|nr:CDP-diacylglycerol--serine O-phosphatidyltransferase [Pirellulales bacterium]